jgi:methyl-accepting chemotaxis protein
MSVAQGNPYYQGYAGQPGSAFGPLAESQPGQRGWRFTIAQKLLAAFLGVALLMAGLGAFASVQLERVSQVGERLAVDNLPATRSLGVFDAETTRFRAAQFAHQLSHDPAEMAPIERELERSRKAAEDALSEYALLATTPQEQQLVSSIRRKWESYVTDNERRVLVLSRGNRDDEVAAYLLNDGKRMFDSLRDDVGPLLELEMQHGHAAASLMVHTTAQSERLIVVAIVAGLAGALALGLLISRGISRGVRQVTTAARGLARGELGQQVEIRSNDELGEMVRSFLSMMAYLRGMASAADAIARGDLTQEVRPQSADDVLGVAFQRMSANLRELTAELQGAGSDLAAATAEILAAVSQQSAGAAEQSAAITQTSATVDEVKVSSEQSVQTAVSVAEIAQQADQVAGEGVTAVSHATDGMVDIRQKVQLIAENILALSEQTQQIGEIIATVNDLADQSNLLALNAAIEASRAGEHGRGFAVVASEIRNLAEQSKTATAQVSAILSDIQRATHAAVMATEQGTKGVDRGSDLIDQAGRTISDLAEVVQQAAQSAHQIAASVRQHSVGMEQIAVAMANINQATSQGLAATSNTKGAAEHLTDLAGRLNGLVARYQV